MPFRAVDRVFKRAVDEGLVPGVVATLCSAAGPCHEAAFGALATEPYRPMRADAVFRIASMTKLVTSVAIMRLVDQGAVDLEAPLKTYVPGFVQPEVLVELDAESGRYSTRPAVRDASLRELLSHTGGYGYWFLHDALRIASGSNPDLLDPPFLIADPGTQFAYSTSADVIGRLIEPVTGLPLEVYFETQIFAPLGMVDTGYRLPADPGRLTHVHRRAGSGFKALPLETEDQPVRGGGGLYSTAQDYARLLQCLLAGGVYGGTRILSAASVDEISRNQIGGFKAEMQRSALSERTNDFIFMDGTQKFGFGVMIGTRQRTGRRSRGAYGWGGIVNTYFWVDSPRDLAAVLMMQIAPFANRASVELLDAFEAAVYGG